MFSTASGVHQGFKKCLKLQLNFYEFPVWSTGNDTSSGVSQRDRSSEPSSHNKLIDLPNPAARVQSPFKAFVATNLRTGSISSSTGNRWGGMQLSYTLKDARWQELAWIGVHKCWMFNSCANSWGTMPNWYRRWVMKSITTDVLSLLNKQLAKSASQQVFYPVAELEHLSSILDCEY